RLPETRRLRATRHRAPALAVEGDAVAGPAIERHAGPLLLAVGEDRLVAVLRHLAVVGRVEGERRSGAERVAEGRRGMARQRSGLVREILLDRVAMEDEIEAAAPVSEVDG